MSHQLELTAIKRAWLDEAVAAFESRSFSIGTFTADDLHQYLPKPDHDGWWGCLVAKLRCASRIREVGRVRSARPERNGAKITLWQNVQNELAPA